MCLSLEFDRIITRPVCKLNISVLTDVSLAQPAARPTHARASPGGAAVSAALIYAPVSEAG